jgi:membrane-associated phospholipid phosphatase
VKEAWADFRAFLAAAWRERPRHLLPWLIVLVLIAAAGAAAFRIDRAVAALAPPEGGPLSHLAGEFSFWGDFPTGTILISLALVIVGTVRQRPAWRRAGFAALLAAVVAGSAVSTARITLGRPRPYATAAEVAGRIGHVPAPLVTFGAPVPPGQLADGFYGPQFPAMFHGFPSGHAATSMATAAALTAALPPLGLGVSLGALGVCWSRVYLRRHYLSDLAVGGGAGIAVGLFFGAVARRRR